MCPPVENPDLVYQQTGHSQSPTHPRSAEPGSRQAIQTRPENSNRVVSPSRTLPGDMQQVALTPNRHFCNKVHQQVSPVCITSTGSPGLGSRCTRQVMGSSGPICISTSSHLGQSGGEVAGLPMQENHSDCPGLALHALVVGFSDHVQPNPTEPSLLAKSAHTIIQSDSTQESIKPKSTCVAPRASATKEQGFSEVVAAQIEAPQRGSTRSVYEAKWAIFLQSGASVIRWTSGHPL